MTGRALPALVWAGLAVALAAAIAVGARSALAPARDDTALRVPEFSLTDRSGRTITRADLEGSWWVADFVFTRCTGICPLLTARMADLAQRLPDVRLVSFSVDPGFDTPQVLARYAETAVPDGAPGRWLFLTGPRQELHALIGEGFKLAVSDTAPLHAADGELVTHSDRLVLVDPEGYIRGYYHGTDEDAALRVAEELARLRGE